MIDSVLSIVKNIGNTITYLLVNVIFILNTGMYSTKP